MGMPACPIGRRTWQDTKVLPYELPMPQARGGRSHVPSSKEPDRAGPSLKI